MALETLLPYVESVQTANQHRIEQMQALTLLRGQAEAVEATLQEAVSAEIEAMTNLVDELQDIIQSLRELQTQTKRE